MPPSLTLAVVLHARDTDASRRPYLLWPIVDVWRDQGHRVHIVQGPDVPHDADVVVPHMDLTTMPAAYTQALDAHPRVLNRAVRDLSKRVVSRNLVGRDASWEGPVIVKTDANHGGLPDHRLLTPDAGKPRSWRRRRTMRSEHYPVFASLHDVPRSVFSNPALVVERFLPEREGELHAVRSYVRCAGHETCSRKMAREPSVKSRHVVAREAVPVVAEARAFADAMGLDYGKVDYVVHQDEVVVLDVSATPTGAVGPLPFAARQVALARAEAALALFGRWLAAGPEPLAGKACPPAPPAS